MRDILASMQYQLRALPALLPLGTFLLAIPTFHHKGPTAALAVLAVAVGIGGVLLPRRWWGILVLTLIMVLTGLGRLYRLYRHGGEQVRRWDGRRVRLEGRVVSPDAGAPTATYVDLATDLGRIRLYDAKRHLLDRYPFVYDDRLAVEVRLREPEPARNPGAWDARDTLRRDGIFLTGQIDEPAVHGYQYGRRYHPLRLLYTLRDRVRRRMRERLGDRAALPLAMVLADKRVLDPALRDHYAELGMAHYLVTSGAHVAIFSGTLHTLFRLFGWRLRTRRVAHLTVLLLYAGFSAFTPAVVRATATAAWSLVTDLRGISGSAMQRLTVSSLIVLILAPQMALNLGFMLSLGMTGWIVLTVSSFAPDARPTRRRMVARYVGVVAAAALPAMPLNLYLNGTFHLLSVPLNLIMMPFLQVMHAVTLIVVLLLPLPAAWTRLPVMLLREWTRWAEIVPARIVAVGALRPPFAVYIPLLGLCAAYAAARSLRMRERRWGSGPKGAHRAHARHRRWIWPLVVVVLATCQEIRHLHQDPTRSVTLLDIGQGDCVHLYERGKLHLLIDTGPPDRLLRFWDGYRRERRLPGKVDLLLTHFDIDHRGEAETMIQRGEVRTLYLAETLLPSRRLSPEEVASQSSRVTEGDKGKSPGVPSPHGSGEPPASRDLETAEALLALCRRHGVTVQPLVAGDVIRGGSFHLHVLPDLPGGDSNNRSLVLLMEHGAWRALLTGDAEAPREALLCDTMELPACHVLKVGHHGSARGSTAPFLAEVKPDYAWISCGRNNRYGHPAPEVLDRLTAAGSKVLRTDEAGAIIWDLGAETTAVDTMQSIHARRAVW